MINEFKIRMISEIDERIAEIEIRNAIATAGYDISDVEIIEVTK